MTADIHTPTLLDAHPDTTLYPVLARLIAAAEIDAEAEARLIPVEPPPPPATPRPQRPTLDPAPPRPSYHYD